MLLLVDQISYCLIEFCRLTIQPDRDLESANYSGASKVFLPFAFLNSVECDKKGVIGGRSSRVV